MRFFFFFTLKQKHAEPVCSSCCYCSWRGKITHALTEAHTHESVSHHMCTLHTEKHTSRKGKVGKMPYLRMAVSPCLTVMLSVPRVKSTLRTGSPVGRRQSNLSRTSGNCFRSGWALATMAGLVEFRCLYLALSLRVRGDRCRKKNNKNNVQLSLWSTAPERGGDFTVLLSCHFLLLFSVSCWLLPPPPCLFFFLRLSKKSLSTTFNQKRKKKKTTKRKKVS